MFCSFSATNSLEHPISGSLVNQIFVVEFDAQPLGQLFAHDMSVAANSREMVTTIGELPVAGSRCRQWCLVVLVEEGF